MDRDRELVHRLCNLEIPSEIKISPSGERVLYSTKLTWGHVKGKIPVTTLWLATLGQANSAKKITDGTYADHTLAWHPFKDEFAFVSDRAENAVKSAIYTMSPTDIGNAVPITSVENEQTIEKFTYSPDGRMIAFISKDEKTEEERRREDNQEDVQVWGEGYRFSRLRVIDLESSEVRTLPLDRHVLDLCWIPENSDGSGELEIGFISCENTLFEQPYRMGTEIHIVEATLKQPRKICSFPGKSNDLCWGTINFGESEELYFWSSSPPNKTLGGNRLYRVSTTDKSCEYEQVSLEKDFDLIAVQSVDGYIVAKAQDRLRDCLIRVGSETLFSCEQEIEAYDVAFGFSDGQIRLAIATSDVNHPIEVYVVEGCDGKMLQVSKHGEPMEGQKFGAYKVISCATSDQHQVDIDGIYLTPDSKGLANSVNGPGEACPTVVLVHGGPHARVTNAFNTLYYMWTPYLLSLGFGILLPNYRGSSGRGVEFSSFSYGGVGIHDYADIIALTQCAIEKGYADPDRLIIAGCSQGGLLANLCALRNGRHAHGWTFKAAISVSGISDIDTMGLTSDVGNVYQAALHDGALPWTRSPDDISTRTASALWAFKEAVERSEGVDVIAIPPTLILHGANDERCPVSQAWGMQRALEHYSLPFEMAIYPRQGHVFREQYFWIDMALRIGRWVERHIGSGRGNPTTVSSVSST